MIFCIWGVSDVCLLYYYCIYINVESVNRNIDMNEQGYYYYYYYYYYYKFLYSHMIYKINRATSTHNYIEQHIHTKNK